LAGGLVGNQTLKAFRHDAQNIADGWVVTLKIHHSLMDFQGHHPLHYLLGSGKQLRRPPCHLGAMFLPSNLAQRGA
jgi:hypothetical protein